MAHASPTADIIPFRHRQPRAGGDVQGRTAPRTGFAFDALAAARAALGDAPRDPGGIEPSQSERVADLLRTLDDAPLMRPVLIPGRDLTGAPWVLARVGGRTFRLFPDDCRLAADALVAEQAFPGCIATAGDLRETAALAEARAGLIRPPRTHGATGMASTLAFALMILCAALLAAWRGA